MGSSYSPTFDRVLKEASRRASIGDKLLFHRELPGAALSVRRVSGAVTASTADDIIVLTGAATVTLGVMPAGSWVEFKLVSNAATVFTALGERTIDGEVSLSVSGRYSALRIVFDGTEWLIM